MASGTDGKTRNRNMIEWVGIVAGALILALIVKTFLFQAFYIPSGSMEPTLKKGDRVLVNKLSYDVHDVHRGDVQRLRAPAQRADLHQGPHQAGHRPPG